MLAAGDVLAVMCTNGTVERLARSFQAPPAHATHKADQKQVGFSPQSEDPIGRALTTRSGAAVGDDQISRDHREEPEREQIQAKRPMPVATHGGPDLPDNV